MARLSRPLGTTLLLLAIALSPIAYLLAEAPTAEASHVRYFTLDYEDTGGNTIDFTIQMGFRRTAYTTCYTTPMPTTVPCSGGDNRPLTGDIFREGSGNTFFAFGDGGQTPTLYFQVTAADVPNNVVYAKALDPTAFPAVDTEVTRTYPSASTFTAYVASCCRISANTPPFWHANNPDGQYRFETSVAVGSGNHAPVTSADVFTLCQIGTVCSYTLPASDADGDAVTCRFPLASEASSMVQPTIGGSPLQVSSTCVITWDLTGITSSHLVSGLRNVYSTQQILEDHLGGAAGPVRSKVPLDYFVELTVASATVPGAPINLACGQGATPGTVDLSWSAPFSNGGSVITNYVIYRGSSPGTATFVENSGADLAHADASLVPGATYYYQVAAENGVGTGARSAEIACVATAGALLPPVPELPALALSALGLVGIAGLVALRRRQ